MKNFFTLLAFAPLTLAAQITHDVEVGGSLGSPSNLPFYEPMDLTINVGDIVRWTNNDDGNHNIYAMQDVFPDNPDGFTSGDPDDIFVFSHTFTQVGVWDYHCTQNFQGQFHSTTQFGTVTVVDPENGIRPVATNRAVLLFPNPAGNEVMLSLKGCTGASMVEIVKADGRTVRSKSVKDNTVNIIDLAGLAAGQYYMMMDRGRRTALLPFVKQ